jgi:glycosyltransferase involved in cell wall biosynthesis
LRFKAKPMDILVFSHLRWDFVYQRPQHLLSRFAREHRVVFWEEPVYSDVQEPSIAVSPREGLLEVVVPVLPNGTSEHDGWALQKDLLKDFLGDSQLEQFAVWYYTPMARHFTRDLEPATVVYDCMDELSAFRGAPPGLTSAEAELFRAADLVFTGGRSLYESKKNHHHSVHLFPSSIDTEHFAKARQHTTDPQDQASISRRRIGYCGVIDERMNLELLGAVADLRPDWQFVMLGPIVKITDADLPTRENIHYLGAKKYGELPGYFSGWDVGMLPFALNDSTRFISPTKTPEYLAAGLPVVSTPITDVVRPYGEMGLVEIVETPEAFVSATERLLARDRSQEDSRLSKVDGFLSQSSWDQTFNKMRKLILEVAEMEKSPLQSDQNVGEIAAAD